MEAAKSEMTVGNWVLEADECNVGSSGLNGRRESHARSYPNPLASQLLVPRGGLLINDALITDT